MKPNNKTEFFSFFSMYILSPVTQLGASVLVTPTVGSLTLTKAQKALLLNVQTHYSGPLASPNFAVIPQNYGDYQALYNALLLTKADNAGNGDLALLLQLALDALKGAMNALSLNAANETLQKENSFLEEVINDLLSGTNVMNAMDKTTGGYTLQKGFDLAPLFQYYIVKYGMPASGKGFDLVNLKVVYDELIAQGIDPGVPDFSSIPTASQCAYNTQVVDLYSKLAVYMSAIQKLNSEYELGHLEVVSSLLTQSMYEKLSTALKNLQYAAPGGGPLLPQFQNYENIRKSVGNLLGGLYQAVQQYGILETTKKKLAIDAANAAILLDPVKLREYIQNYNKNLRSREVFPKLHISSAMAVLKPQYSIYISLYGFPEGGIWDMDKLGAILLEMEASNT